MKAAVHGRRVVTLSVPLLLCLLLPRALLSQPPESLNVDVGECVKLESPGARLDCFEQQVERAQAKPPVPPPTPATPPAAAPSQAAAPRQTPPAAPTERAAAPSQPPAAAPSRRAARDDEPGERAVSTEDVRIPRGTADGNSGKITAAISALRETVPNAWLITLDNGQVWRQDYPAPYPLRVGQRVEISSSGRLAGVRLTAAGSRGSIQVERVR